MNTRQYRAIYRFLVKCRNALDALIARVRVKAFPESNGMRRKRAETTATPPASEPAKESL